MKKNYDVFDFVAFMGPPPKNATGDRNISPDGNEDFQTDEHYSNVKNCGFNCVCATYEYTLEEYKKALIMCEKHGLSFVVRDQNRLDYYLNEYEGEDIYSVIESKSREFYDFFGEYLKYSSFAGYLASDEPPIRKYPYLKAGQEWFEKNCPNKFFQVNLLPNYANGEQLTGYVDGEYNYEKYLDDFITILNPHYLSYDHYALIEDRKTGERYIRQSYLENLEIVAEKVKQANIDFSVFLLTLGHWDFRTVSSYEEIAWQVYTAMAYGAKGAQTFTYWTMLNAVPGNSENVSTALVGINGELLPAWYAMQQVISEVRFFEREYLSFKWQKTVCVSGKGKEKNPLFTRVKGHLCENFESIQCTEDIIVGCFLDGKKQAYLISNVTDPKDELKANVSITLKGEKNISIYKKLNKTVVNGKELDFALGSGEGVFIVVE